MRLNVDASSRLETITSNVERVAEVVGETAPATEHQSRGIAQINSVVDEMSK